MNIVTYLILFETKATDFKINFVIRGRVLEIPDLVYELEDDGHMKLLGDRNQLDLDALKVRVQYALGAD